MNASESAIVGTLLAEYPNALPPNVARLIEYAPDSFDDQRCGLVSKAIRETEFSGEPVNVISVRKRLNGDIDHTFLNQLTLESLPIDLAELEAQTIWESYRGRLLKSTLADGLAALESDPKGCESVVATMRHTFEALERNSGNLLEARKFNPDLTPPELRPVFTLAGSCICTPGNITTITAQVKTGKSAVIGAMLSATMQHIHDADLLGFKSRNPDNLAVLHFDSEQSPDDHWHQIKRALERAGLAKPPPWFHSYCLTGLSFKEAWRCVKEASGRAVEAHGGIHSMLIDGAADLVADVNDAAECNATVAQLHDMAIKHDCPIVVVIHFNPGTEKTRGHLGSQLERKAETNLRLDKADGVTTIWSDKQRRAPIPKDTGPCFQWSDEAGMHVSLASRQASKDELEILTLKEQFAEVFSGRASMRFSELEVTLKKTLRVSNATAQRKIEKALKLKVIKKSFAGQYTIGS